MKFCPALSGSLNIERDRVHFCYATKQNMPTIPWNIDEDLPLEHIRLVRDALVKGLNEDMDKPVPEYVAYGRPSAVVGHPCKGCRHIIDVPNDFEIPSTEQLTCYLHMQAFTYCNAKCTYCNLRIDEGMTPLNRGHDLDTAICRAVMQLIDADAIAPSCRVIFSSGEPSLSRESMKLLSYVNSKGLKILINTNAICYASEIEEALKSGKTHVQVSLESGDRQNFIEVKGVDKFDSVAENIDRYMASVRGESTFWLKYIVFSKTNSRVQMDNFVNLCIQHKVKNVVVNANYNEGEAVSMNCSYDGKERQEESADIESLRAFGYLATRLELQGICVHKELSHLTKNEQELAKYEYAKAVLDALDYTGDDIEACITNIVEGFEMAMLPIDDPCLKIHMSKLLQRETKDSKGIALFGAGGHAQWISNIMDELGMNPVVAFDNNPKPHSRFKFPVVKPAEILQYDVDTVIVASNAYHLQIYSQMIRMPYFTGQRIIDPYLNLPKV